MIIQMHQGDTPRIHTFDEHTYVDIESPDSYSLGIVVHRYLVDDNRRRPIYLLHKESSYMLWIPRDKEDERPDWWKDAEVVWFWKHSKAAGGEG